MFIAEPARPDCQNANTPRRALYRRGAGFTLLELMVVLAIMAVLVGIAAPSLGHWIKNNRLEASARETLAMVRLARTEAIGRNRITKVEFNDQRQFWSCEVAARDEACSDDEDDNSFIRAVEWNQDRLSVASNGQTATVVAFDVRGRRVLKNGAIDITVCDERGSDYGMVININQVGRATLNDIDTSKGEACL